MTVLKKNTGKEKFANARMHPYVWQMLKKITVHCPNELEFDKRTIEATKG